MSLDWVADPDDERVQAAMAWTCDLCSAKAGQLCSNPIDPSKPLPSRAVHYGRLIDRRKKGKDE